MGFAYQAEMKASFSNKLALEPEKRNNFMDGKFKETPQFFNFGICNIYVMSVSFVHDMNRYM